MQTYLVHTREPRRLHAELGWRGSVGFHALMGGLILSALVHPLFYGLLVYFLITGDLLVPAESRVGAAFWAIAWVNLGVGYVISILIGMLSVCRRRRFRLVFSCLLMPVYWLLISLAAYRALYQLMRKPYLWEKTEHRGEARRQARTRLGGRRCRATDRFTVMSCLPVAPRLELAALQARPGRISSVPVVAADARLLAQLVAARIGCRAQTIAPVTRLVGRLGRAVESPAADRGRPRQTLRRRGEGAAEEKGFRQPPCADHAVAPLDNAPPRRLSSGSPSTFIT